MLLVDSLVHSSFLSSFKSLGSPLLCRFIKCGYSMFSDDTNCDQKSRWQYTDKEVSDLLAHGEPLIYTLETLRLPRTLPTHVSNGIGRMAVSSTWAPDLPKHKATERWVNQTRMQPSKHTGTTTTVRTNAHKIETRRSNVHRTSMVSIFV